QRSRRKSRSTCQGLSSRLDMAFRNPAIAASNTCVIVKSARPVKQIGVRNSHNVERVVRLPAGVERDRKRVLLLVGELHNRLAILVRRGGDYQPFGRQFA